MKPRAPESQNNDDLFRSRLENIISLRHPLVKLSEQINWEALDNNLSQYYEPAVVGQPPKSTRLMAGMLYLKHTYGLSDEELVERWVESPYMQFFCGEVFFQHEAPIHPTSLTRYRHRIGSLGMNELLKATIDVALRQGVLEEKDLKDVIVDTTVMEKAVTFPTDSKLLLKALNRLTHDASELSIPLRQSYRRVAKKLAMQSGRYAHARQFKRMRRVLNKLKARVGRVVRDIERKTSDWSSLPDRLMTNLSLAKRLLNQKPGDKNKLYSLHAPEVECISKGKAHKRYEFGVKVGFVASANKPFLLAANCFVGNPYDGHTLVWSLARAKRNTGVPIERAGVDKGYRGSQHDWPDCEIVIPGQRSKDEQHKKQRHKLIKRRSVIEALIGHMKNDGLLNKNWLKGTHGDAYHAILCAVGMNMRQLLRAIEAFLKIKLSFGLISLFMKKFSRLLSGWELTNNFGISQKKLQAFC